MRKSRAARGRRTIGGVHGTPYGCWGEGWKEWERILEEGARGTRPCPLSQTLSPNPNLVAQASRLCKM